MVDPIVTPIIGCVFMGILVINALVSSGIRLASWISEKVEESEINKEPISKADAGDYIAAVMCLVDKWESFNAPITKVATTPMIVTFSNGKAVFDVPCKGHSKKFEKWFTLETMFYGDSPTIMGIKLTWASEDDAQARNYLNNIKKSLDVRSSVNSVKKSD